VEPIGVNFDAGQVVRGHLPTGKSLNSNEIEVCENIAHGCGLSQHQKDAVSQLAALHRA
jgi:hypothetical protein